MAHVHELVTGIAAPWVVLSPVSGQLTGTGAEGVYARDRRILSRCEVALAGAELIPLDAAEPGAALHEYVAAVTGLTDDGHNPTVHLHRVRELTGTGLTETVRLVNRSRHVVDTTLTVALGTDLAGIAAIRSGATRALPSIEPTPTTDGWQWTGDTVRVSTELAPRTSPAPAPPAGDALPAQSGQGDPSNGSPSAIARAERALEDGTAVASWQLQVEPGAEVEVLVRVAAEFAEVDGFRIEAPASRPSYGDVVVACDDVRVERWMRRSLEDLAGLQLGDGEDRYLGAGPPWYLTLFGRDSLISAGMLIPVDLDLAAGTLRALARRQGTKVDPDTAEQPGKIPHELREETADHGGGLVLPPVYYGTHDATQLWIITLHKAWRWGMPDDQVRALLPNLDRALHWITDHADPDGDGFLEYLDESGHGLANQGWKDSDDAVQWPDGTIAKAPIALCEVQGYAYAAAIHGAELLAAYGQDGSRWRDWAAALKTRFRESFWVDGYPAIALDGDKRPVPGLASNMGHLLGTGLLDAEEETAVVRYLASSELDSGFGLRTLSTAMARFNPLGYHTGSVWPHDTAMTVEGLYASGHAELANSYLTGLLRAAEAFDYRLPELYGGRGIDHEPTPTPYPSSCRPQAWAAAAAIGVLVAAVQSGQPPWPRLTISGLGSVQRGEGGGPGKN